MLSGPPKCARKNSQVLGLGVFLSLCQTRLSNQGITSGCCRQLDLWDSKWECRLVEPASSLSPPPRCHAWKCSGIKGQGYRLMVCSKPSLTSAHFVLAVTYKWQSELREVRDVSILWFSLQVVELSRRAWASESDSFEFKTISVAYYPWGPTQQALPKTLAGYWSVRFRFPSCKMGRPAGPLHRGVGRTSGRVRRRLCACSIKRPAPLLFSEEKWELCLLESVLHPP